MDRLQLLHALNNYKSSFDEEKAFIPRFTSLLTNFSNCYSRSLLTGHITASAWIVDEIATSALLVHHKKLNRWLQPGGHADAEENIILVATKEAKEETGLKSLKLFDDNFFDIDIHLIPSHKNIQSHYHYDIRFLFFAESAEAYIVSDESNKLAWVPIDKIDKFTENNDSILRMVFKTKSIF